MMIRPVSAGDARDICGIYNYFVENTAVSFEEEPVPLPEMESRIRAISAAYPWFVREEGGAVLGYAYANRFRDRAAYRYTAELSIYVKSGHEGKGIGGGLFARLLEAMKESSVHALVSGITVPNERSVGLHEKFGFVNVALFSETGYKLGRWHDVGYWELVLKK
ncbi:MAG: GNAT family N-acetyltransferase [Treponema sp.]|jgi:phosphinothricin acetyltransferase|nr:GNAT family N-acetyltransferase [Treponema sp.]